MLFLSSVPGLVVLMPFKRMRSGSAFRYRSTVATLMLCSSLRTSSVRPSCPNLNAPCASKDAIQTGRSCCPALGRSGTAWLRICSAPCSGKSGPESSTSPIFCPAHTPLELLGNLDSCAHRHHCLFHPTNILVCAHSYLRHHYLVALIVCKVRRGRAIGRADRGGAGRRSCSPASRRLFARASGRGGGAQACLSY